MSLGFELAGFEIIAAIDSDPIHVVTHKKNFPFCHTLQADASRLSGDDLRTQTEIGKRHIDVIFGGPPCQGFSIIGRRQSDDPRNRLLYDFARLVTDLQPDYFVLENVRGLMIGSARYTLNLFLSRVSKAGYSYVEPVSILNSVNFGIPQRRRRLFIMGYRKDRQAPIYPKPSRTREETTKTSPTAWDAIGDLPVIDQIDDLLYVDTFIGTLGAPSEYARKLRLLPARRLESRYIERRGISGCSRTVHTPDTIRRFSATEPGSYEPVSRFYRLHRDGIAPTLRAGSGSSHGSYTAPRPIHPVSPRCITVREAARLHSFPDWFDFNPTIWHGFRQVGNSVPPLLARAVAKELLRAITR